MPPSPLDRLPAAAPDPWVTAAAAVRHAVLTTEGVADLSGSARYRTQGRGGVVRGVGLQAADAGIRVNVALVLSAEALRDHGALAGVQRRVRAAAAAAWARAGVRTLGDLASLDLVVHVVDLVAEPSWAVEP